MSDHLTEEEQLENLKRLWKEYGSTIIASIVIAASTYFGWNYWQEQTRIKAESASAAFEESVVVVTQKSTADAAELTALNVTVNHLAEKIKTIDPNSHYALNATLFKAKQAIDANQLDEAVSEFQWALEHSKDAGITQIIVLRLARVLAASEQYSEALSLLTEKPSTDFVALRAEVRGDILHLQGNSAAAVTAYKKSLEHLEGDSQHRVVLQMKLDDLKTAKNAGEPSA